MIANQRGLTPPPNHVLSKLGTLSLPGAKEALARYQSASHRMRISFRVGLFNGTYSSIISLPATPSPAPEPPNCAPCPRRKSVSVRLQTRALVLQELAHTKHPLRPGSSLLKNPHDHSLGTEIPLRRGSLKDTRKPCRLPVSTPEPLTRAA